MAATGKELKVPRTPPWLLSASAPAATGKELKVLSNFLQGSQWVSCAATGKELKAQPRQRGAVRPVQAATGKELKAEPGPDVQDGAEDEDSGSNWERIERGSRDAPQGAQWVEGSNWERIESFFVRPP